MGWLVSAVRLLFLTGMVLALAAPAAAEKRVALVVGNSNYAHAPPLKNPTNDATAMAAVLSRAGFQVISGTDLAQTEFQGKVRDFTKALRGADVSLFFYAGHGLQVSGVNYLAPVDAVLEDEADLDFETVSIDTILKQMQRETGTALVFLDACRNNPLSRSMARSMGTRAASVGRGLAKVQAGAGSFIAFATEPDNVAEDGEGDNSPFTTAILKHIETPDLDVAQLLRRVRKDVIESTAGRQVPWENSSLTSDFRFVSTGAGEPVEAPATLIQPQPEPPRVEVDPAKDAWTAIMDSQSPGVLRSFVDQFPDSVYAGFAKARIEELAALAKPEPPPEPDPPPPPVAHTRPSWCPKAKLAAELAVCDSATLSALDRQLSGLYTRARQRDPSIRTVQRQWLAERDSCGYAEDCIEQLYRSQIDYLANAP